MGSVYLALSDGLDRQMDCQTGWLTGHWELASGISGLAFKQLSAYEWQAL